MDKNEMTVEAYLNSPISIKDISVEFITPDRAREWLAGQGTNRKRKERLINKICHDIENGLWRVNGGTFCFDKHGRLVDGQHRCMGIIRSNIGVWAIIVRNVSDDAVQTIDIGVSRTAGDIFSFSDIKDANLKAAVVRAARNIEINASFFSHETNTINAAYCPSTEISSVALLNLYLENAEDYDYSALKCVSYCSKLNLINKSYLGGVIYHLIHVKKHPKEKVEEFMDNLFIKRDADLEVINVLRDKLIDFRMRKKTSAMKMNGIYINALFIKTWNAYITKKDLKVLSYSEKKEGVLRFI